jgi:capsular polysaccharide biosynthesis protein
VVDLGHAVATCCDHWDANYYHWVAHTLPTVHAVMHRHPDGAAGLIVPRMAPWQRASLALLGAAGLPCIALESSEQYFLPRVEYYDFVAGRADFSISALSQAAYARMADSINATAPTHRLIYIDRSASANRRLPNEAALIQRLQLRGFNALRPETLSLDAQIALFSGAAMIVGQLGAGLANIAFCRPGTVVYELVPEHHANPCFVALAMQAGLHYWGDVFSTGVANGDHTSAWVADIDVDHVMRRIEELAALVPA